VCLKLAGGRHSLTFVLLNVRLQGTDMPALSMNGSGNKQEFKENNGSLVL
jgi:hypothetical protein